MNALNYLSGFGNYLQSEAVSGALPQGCNSPQQAPLGLYAEQLSGNAFTSPSYCNVRSWLYRILPSVAHGQFRIPDSLSFITTTHEQPFFPTQMRWDPMPYPELPTDFLQGLACFADQGSIATHSGAATHLYAINKSMTHTYFSNADGDFLFVPQEGGLRLKTELGILEIHPGEIAVIQRGMYFQVELLDAKARGYICENYGAHFSLPARGPIGASGLANERDFQIPVASFEDKTGTFLLVTKFQGQLWEADIDHSPLNVVAWHGNYVPYKYNLRDFNTINTVSYDHPDPSIFTVLTSSTDTPGVANVDFVIFPDRWMVAENTFRPPYYHRNIMSEFMGLIYGTYDAKEQGFLPGGCSLHNCMSAHGPDAAGYEKNRAADLKPEFYSGTLAFMFESRYAWRATDYALNAAFRQSDYLDCWQGLKKRFE